MIQSVPFFIIIPGKNDEGAKSSFSLSYFTVTLILQCKAYENKENGIYDKKEKLLHFTSPIWLNEPEI